jgi:DNA-binding NarL/FixJ family response regulator
MAGTMSNRPRVFIVEDHELTRAGARHFLGDRFEVVGDASGVGDAVTGIRQLRPDIVLLDLRIEGGTGIDVAAEVRETHPDVKLLALTVSTSRDDVVRLFDIGVDGYLTKAAVGIDLPGLVEDALRGAKPISRQVAAYLLDIDEDVADDSGVSRLTPREKEVTALVARGYSYREAATELGISVKTLEKHVGHVFEKLGVASRYELDAVARDTGFVDRTDPYV